MEGHPYDFDRAEVLPFLPAADAVLDVGCSTGRFCAVIKRARPETTVWGIEPHTEAAEQARSHADHVITGLFPEDLPADAPKFDAVFFNDVLEHLVDPWDILARTRPLLSGRGVVVASIPNARYWELLFELVFRRNFQYTEAGILDRTHLRFFTKSTMEQLFSSSGYEIELCQPINSATSWKVALMSLLFGSDIRHLQYVVVGRPRAGRA